MTFFRILGAYSVWHYSQGVKELTELWGNFIVFVNHFFSIPLLLRTLLAPWRRMGVPTRAGGFNPGAFFGDLIVNILMRLVGFCVRVPTILLGMFFIILPILIYPLLVVLWVILPPICLFLVLGGLWIGIFGL